MLYDFGLPIKLIFFFGAFVIFIDDVSSSGGSIGAIDVGGDGILSGPIVFKLMVLLFNCGSPVSITSTTSLLCIELKYGCVVKVFDIVAIVSLVR